MAYSHPETVVVSSETLASASSLTRQIIGWILSEDVQQAINDGCNCKLVVNISGGTIATVIEKHRKMEVRDRVSFRI